MADVKEWIIKQLKTGYSKERIRQALIARGFDPNLIDKLMRETLKVQDTYNKSMSKSYTTIVLVAIVSLIVGGVFAFLFVSNGSNIKIKELRADIEKLQSSSEKIKYEDILNRNPALGNYTKADNCREDLGFVYSPPESAYIGKPRIGVLTFNDEIIGVEFVWPASEGWFSYADQTKDNPELINDMPSYTQKIYFKKPPTLQDCYTTQ